MNILAIVNGEYGRRHVRNISAHMPGQWKLDVWEAPTVLPPVVDYPEDHLPDSFDPTDLILALAEHRGVGELLPDIARMSGASAVIAAVDREEWLPRGLARQLRGWLADAGVVCVTPKPLCSLTKTDYGIQRREQMKYENSLISEFAHYFGRPRLELKMNPDTRIIETAEVVRDAFCGCARFVAEGLVGVIADDAVQKAGLLHHHYPCLASMGIDSDFGDTLMHVSGNILKDEVAEQVRPYVTVTYISPSQRSE